MKMNKKDCVLYMKAGLHAGSGKRKLVARGSMAYLEACCAMSNVRPSKVNIVSAAYWTEVMGEELTIKEINDYKKPK
jgi:hypothetical protein